VAIFKNDVVQAVDVNGELNYVGYAYRAIETFGISYGELGRLVQHRKSFKSPNREVPVWFSVVAAPEHNVVSMERREDPQTV
jgi:hypothetical protein